MKKFSLLLITFLLSMLFLSCTREENDNNNGEPVATGVRNVRAAEAVRKDFYSGIEATGRIESDVYVNITPSITGRVEKLHVREGSIVRKGDLLLELEDLNLVQAEQHYQNLQKNYQRMLQLYRTDAIDQQSYEEIAAAYQIAKRNYEFALENTRITAPIDGKIVSIALKEGENYAPMTLPALIKILSLQQMKAVTHLSDRDYARIETGSRATVRVDALPDRTFEGRINFISTQADPMSGTFRCEIIIDEGNDLLRHNQFARVFLVIDRAKDTIVVPAAAIVNDNTVFVVEEDRAFRRTVETGIYTNIEVEILSGIEEGDQVVILGNIGLTDNYPVNIID